MTPTQESLQRHRDLLARQPSNGLARFSLGKALFDAREFAEAQAHLTVALAGRPDWMVVRILIGKCELELGDPVAARRSFETARELAIAQHHEGPLSEIDSLLSELN